MYLGSLTAIGVSGSEQNSEASATFGAAINNPNLTISKADNVNVLSGVNAADNTLAGVITAEVFSKAADLGFILASVTTQNATVNADSNVNVNANNIKANNMKLASNLNKTAKTGSTDGNLGLISASALNLKSTVGGTSSITLAGGSEIAKDITIEMNDTSNAHNKW